MHLKLCLLIAALTISLTNGLNAEVTKAIAAVHPTAGNTAEGIITFTTSDDGLLIHAEISGLTPGKHGFHIHQFGDCSGADGKTAGGHFNPAGSDHGGPDSDHRHVGDLGNLEANDEGKAVYDREDTHLTFSGDRSIIGYSVIIHAGEDDLTSQPTGAAGARVACGVIGVAKAEIAKDKQVPAKDPHAGHNHGSSTKMGSGSK